MDGEQKITNSKDYIQENRNSVIDQVPNGYPNQNQSSNSKTICDSFNEEEKKSKKDKVVTFKLERNQLHEVYKVNTITFEDIIEENDPQTIEIIIDDPAGTNIIPQINERSINFNSIRSMFDAGIQGSEYTPERPKPEEFPKIENNPFIKNDRNRK